MLKEPIITKNDIIQALKESGIKDGDILFVHSSVGKFGCVKEAKDKMELANLIVDCFLDVIGSTGTLIVPTFTYSFTNNEIFDVNNTASTVGILTEVVRNRKDAIRSIHPIFSVAAIGPKSKYFTSDLDKTSFDRTSFFGKLLDINTKHVFFGADMESCTFIHLIEKDFAVPYRYEKDFSGYIINNGIKYRDIYTFYVRYLDKNVDTYLTRFQSYLVSNGFMKEVKLGKGYVRAINSLQLYNVGIDLLKENPYYFLRTTPDLM